MGDLRQPLSTPLPSQRPLSGRPGFAWCPQILTLLGAPPHRVLASPPSLQPQGRRGGWPLVWTEPSLSCQCKASSSRKSSQITSSLGPSCPGLSYQPAQPQMMIALTPPPSTLASGKDAGIQTWDQTDLGFTLHLLWTRQGLSEL